VGLALGIFFLALQWMAHKGYLSNVDWNKIGTDATMWLHGLATQFSNSHIFAALGNPATSGLAVGLAAGLARG
jgi:uncharacterized membrane protein (Fun14 family)